MRSFLLANLLSSVITLGAIAQGTATLTIDIANPVAKVSPTLYGIMTEEINYSYDGGLYAEMVSNRTFQTNRGLNLEHWTLIQNGNSRAGLTIDKTTGPSKSIPHSLRFTVTSADPQSETGFYNTGFWGMALQPSTEYHGSFYAKADSAAIGNISIRLVTDKTGTVVASTSVPSPGNSWERHEFVLKTGTIAPSAENHLEFLVQRTGSAWFSLISLFPPPPKARPR